MKTVVMVGMMGAGKTAVGKDMAQQLSVPFCDSDAEIESAANASIKEIFEQYGEPFFREKEALVITRLLEEEPCILSVGGGAFLNADTRARIHELGVSVWLQVDVETLWNRVRRKDTRPLLRTANPRQTLVELMRDREPAYALADLSVQAEAAHSITQTAERVIATLTSRPDVLRPE